MIDLGETEVWVGFQNEFRNAINNLVLVRGSFNLVLARLDGLQPSLKNVRQTIPPNG